MITHVAIIHNDKMYCLPKPNRHHHIIHQIYLATGQPVDDMIQGFLDDQGNFLNREQALEHVKQCGQEFRKPCSYRSCEMQSIKPKMRDDDWLYSEDVW